MSLQLRRGSGAVQNALVDQLNKLRDINVGANFHASATAGAPSGDPPSATVLSISSPNAVDLPTSIVLSTELFNKLNIHWQDAEAHNTAVTAVLTTPLQVDLATGITLANAIKAALNTHYTAANVHFTNDGTNTIATANASDQASLNALLNAMKTAVTAHIANALAGQHIKLISA